MSFTKHQKKRDTLSLNASDAKFSKKFSTVYCSGWECIQGLRWNMEDTHVAIDDLRRTCPGIDQKHGKIGFYAIFDGHGGSECSLIAETIFIKLLIGNQYFKNFEYEKALKFAFKETNKKIYHTCKQNNWKSGTTALVLLMLEDKFIIGNLGDSEAVLGRKKNHLSSKVESYCLSEKHSPDSDKKRIKKCGGKVVNGRINGTLAVSRGFGDLEFRSSETEGCVTAEPFIKTYQTSYNDQYICLACDGLYDVMTYKQISDLINKQRNKSHSPTSTAEQLSMKAMENGSTDNISIIVIYLFKQLKPKYKKQRKGSMSSSSTSSVPRASQSSPDFRKTIPSTIDDKTAKKYKASKNSFFARTRRVSSMEKIKKAKKKRK